MIDLPTAEKIKHPGLALIVGLLIGVSLGAGAAWTASTTVHDAQFKVLDAVNKDLQRQVAELGTSSQAKDAEIALLREQLGLVSPAKSTKEIKTLVRQLDMEIAQKKRELARVQSLQSEPIFLTRDNPTSPQKPDRQKSAQESRLEKELDSLAVQRDGARRSLIELTTQ